MDYFHHVLIPASPSHRHVERQPQQASQWEQRRVQPEFGPGGVVQQRQQPRTAAHHLALFPPEPPAAAQVPRPIHYCEQPRPDPDQEDGIPSQRGALPAAVPGWGYWSCRGEASNSVITDVLGCCYVFVRLKPADEVHQAFSLILSQFFQDSGGC